MNNGYITACVGCGVNVPARAENVISSRPMNQGILFSFRCDQCGTYGRYLLTRSEVRARKMARIQKERELERKREIGRLVKGFAIDLEVVEFVDDMKIFWDHQERTEPGSIVREEGNAKSG